MTKKQTPITAEEIIRQPKYNELKNLILICEAMDEFAQAKVLEALEREVIKIAADLQYQMFIITSNPTTVGDLEYLKIEAFNRSKDYYETEVKPKYK